MFKLFIKYWDIITGAAVGVGIAIIREWELEAIQLYYSIVISILVTIGVFRVIKQEVEKKRSSTKRKHNIIDDIVDKQKSVKAVSLAQSPTEEGEKVGKSMLILFLEGKKIMEKFKTFFSKFKGYMLTAVLAALTLVELCGGYVNELMGGALTINGVEVFPFVTLLLTVVVGVLSNGYTKEQREKIKALFSKSTTNELVLIEIKKTIKEKTAQLGKFNKVLSTQEHELTNFESELDTLNNTLQAKREMLAMTPKLATSEDVQLAENAVSECKGKISAKKQEIEKTKASIEVLTTNINALKSQL